MKMLIILIGSLSMVTAAPQLDLTENQPTPYRFSYGVSFPATGDEKEHKETVLPSGAVEGEYRWLQPNGLYRTTRYTADDVSGYRAIVSEEPGERVANFYANSLLDASAQTPFIDQGSQQTSSNFQAGNRGPQIIQSQRPSSLQNLQASRPGNRGSQIIQSQRPSSLQNLQASRPATFSTPAVQNQGASNSLTQGQAFTSPSISNLNVPQNTQRVPTFTSTQTSQNERNFIDGGIINGRIIDGGIINGRIIDGGITDSTSLTFGSESNRPASNTGANLSNDRFISNKPAKTPNRFSNPQQLNSDINQGVAVILARNPTQLRGQ